METLPVILNKLYSLLQELESTLAEEISQLSRAQINPVSLQIISDNKSRLLSAINFYDDQRKQEEKLLHTASPYTQRPQLAAMWSDITRVVKKSAEQNQRSYQLMEMHMKKVKEIKQVVARATSSAQLYGQSGNPSNDGSGNVYRVSV